MSTLVGITVPDLAHSDLEFPLVLDYPLTTQLEPAVIIHPFAEADAMVEQRFYRGNGSPRYTLRVATMTPDEHDDLADFWEELVGGMSTWDLAVPQPDGSLVTKRVRFAEQVLSLSYMEGMLSSAEGLTVVEVPTTAPTWSISSTGTRFPSETLATGLTAQVQTLVPLLKIKIDAEHIMYLSDRNCTVGGVAYQARIVEWGPIIQAMNGAADSARFTLGNADRVLSAIANTYQIKWARVEFSLFHVETLIKVDIWAGRLRSYQIDGSAAFPIECDEGLPLSVTYPSRFGSRSCWKKFAGSDCRWTSGTSDARTINRSDGTTRDLTFTPSETECDKTWDGTNGCLAHLNELNFGGIVAMPQPVRLRNDDSIGGILSTTSQISQSIYSQAVPELWCDVSADDDPTHGFPVQCSIMSGRDESEFYAAIGVVSEGPITEYATPTYDPANPNSVIPFKLDGQPWHGLHVETGDDGTSSVASDSNRFGLRLSVGNDPASNIESDKFSLGEGGGGPQRYNEAQFAAGTAFAEIRRTDEKSLQLTPLETHTMDVRVKRALKGWTWATGTRAWSSDALTNPVWIAINVLLRAIGLRSASEADQLAVFDLTSAQSVATDVCDVSVARLVGSGYEKQFVFNGLIKEIRPLKDWLSDVLNSCLGYYVWVFGKLKVGARYNSSAASAYTEGNIIWQSLQLQPTEPEFNRIHVTFTDLEADYADGRVTFEDADAALEAGGGLRTEFHDGELTLMGATKSQALRIGLTRVREEVGGCTATQRAAARHVSLKTTILGLDTEAGMVVSVSHPDCPNFPASADGGTETERDNYVEFRVEQWTLNSDFSVELSGKTTHGDMYNVVAGPKPADVIPDPVIGDDIFPPKNWSVELWSHQDGVVRLSNIHCAQNSSAVRVGRFSLYCIDESTCGYGTIVGGLSDDSTTLFEFSGQPPTEGEWILCGDELMEVLAVTTDVEPNFGWANVLRGKLGTIAAAHPRVSTTIDTIDTDWGCMIALTDATDWHYGSALVVNEEADPAPQRMVTRVDGNDIQITLPFTDDDAVADGNDVYQDPRIWRVRKFDYELSLPPKFFKSLNRADWEQTFALTNAGLVLVTAYLENTRGLQSETIKLWPTSPQRMQKKLGEFHPAWPYRVRTLGNSRILMPYQSVPTGLSADAFHPAPTAHAQAFDWSLATIWKGENDPLDTPPAAYAVHATGLEATGLITLSGTPAATVQLQATVSGAQSIESKTFIAGDHSITGGSTLAQLATAFAAWLNADPFGTFCYAKATGATVEITDFMGRGGDLACGYNDAGVTATASGFSNRLGITKGRRYGMVWAGGGYRSDISFLSPTTGPTGDATRIEIHDLPASPDSRVTTVEVYALPDGDDDIGTPRIVGSATNGTGYFVDETTEADLAGLVAFSDPVQPASDGPVLIEMSKNGFPWFQLRIPADSNISNQPLGFGLDPIQPDVEVNANVTNDAGDGVSLLIEFN